MFEKLNLKYENNKIWMYPLKYIFVAFILSVLTIAVDTKYVYLHKYVPALFLTSIDLAQTILGALVGSLLSITTFTFSTTMVVLTMYSSDFSPRVIQNFLSEKITMKVLGMFMGGFFYSITSLLFMRKSLSTDLVISASIGVVYAILCLFYFAVFINKVSQSIQVNNLVNKLHKEADTTIKNARKFHDNSNFIEDYELGDYIFRRDIKSSGNGYLELVSYKNIFSDIRDGDYILVIHPNNGDFVVRNEVIASLYSKTEEIDESVTEKMHAHFTLQESRNITYDYLFAIEKIVEVSLRALSSGINDPYTSVECINVLGILLSDLSEIDGNFSEMTEEGSNSRIIYKYFNFDYDLYRTLSQTVAYGKDDIEVVLALYKALENIMINATPSNKEHVKKFIEYVSDKTDGVYTHEVDRAVVQKAKERALHSEDFIGNMNSI